MTFCFTGKPTSSTTRRLFRAALESDRHQECKLLKVPRRKQEQRHAWAGEKRDKQFWKQPWHAENEIHGFIPTLHYSALIPQAPSSPSPPPQPVHASTPQNKFPWEQTGRKQSSCAPVQRSNLDKQIRGYRIYWYGFPGIQNASTVEHYWP